MTDLEQRGWRALPLRRLLVIDGVLALVVLAAWLGFGNALARHMEATVDLAFALEADPLDVFAARANVPETNESARRLEALAVPLGIFFVQQDQPEWRERWILGPELDFESVFAKASRYVNCQLENPLADLEPHPSAVAAYFAENEEAFDRLREHLVSEPPPLWVANVPEFPRVSGLAQFRVQRLLAAHALEQLRRGRPEQALRDLEASWNLAAYARSAPFDLYRSYATFSSRLQAGVLRKLEKMPDPWPGRFRQKDQREYSYYGWLVEAYRLRAMVRDRTARRELFTDRESLDLTGLARRWVLRSFVGDPYVRMCLASRLDVARRAARRERQYPRCRSAFDPRSYWPFLDLSFPPPALNWIYRWDLAETWYMGFSERLMRASEDRLLLERELALKVAAIHELRRTQGEWPASVDGGIEESICKGRWIYRGSAQGAYLAYSRALAPLSVPVHERHRRSPLEVPLFFLDGDPPPP